MLFFFLRRGTGIPSFITLYFFSSSVSFCWGFLLAMKVYPFFLSSGVLLSFCSTNYYYYYFLFSLHDGDAVVNTMAKAYGVDS